jgi:hypothetical protein
MPVQGTAGIGCSIGGTRAMGLDLQVGILADLGEADAEGCEDFAGAFARLRSYLVSLGLSPHEEPRGGDTWSAQMLGYSGLHHVRRIAAYLDCRRPLPKPAAKDDPDDPCLAAYYAATDGRQPGMLKRLFGSAPRFQRRFDHLIDHSDAEGFYLPIDFPRVLLPPDELEIPGSMVGSVPRLLAELEQVAHALEIPESLTAESDELWAAADEPRSTGELWRRYGRETFGCVVLREGCRKSLATGAALVFT